MSLGIKEFDLAVFYKDKKNIYSITINPSDSRQYTAELTRNRLKNVLCEISGLMFDNIRPYIKSWILIPEISLNNDLTKLPRIHYHGIIEFESDIEYLRYRINEYQVFNNGFNCEMKPITDLIGWIVYMRKDYERFNKLYEECEVPYQLDYTDLKYTNKSIEKKAMKTLNKMLSVYKQSIYSGIEEDAKL